MIESQYEPVAYVGTGEQTEFPITFTYEKATDIVVKLRHAVTGAETDWTQPADYSVSDGNVVAVEAPSADYKLWIFRNTPRTQEMDFNESTPPQCVEGMGDKLTKVVQELTEWLSRAVLFKKTTAEDSQELPEPENDYFLRWAEGKLTNSKALGGSGYAIQSFMATFLETLTKVAARGAIDALGVADKAADSDKLDNHDSAYFATADHTHNPPIGFVYIQFQGSGALKSAPGSLFSGTWTDITGDEFAGHFFRAYKSGLSAAMGTQQADALQGHEHKHDDPSVISSYRNNLESGSNGNQINAKNVATRGLMSDGVNGTPRSASETRPINYAIHIWERTA